MMDKDDRHLDRDQLLMSLVDESALPLPLQEHLARCPMCRSGKDLLEQDLSGLRQMVRALTPPRSRDVVLPEFRKGRYQMPLWRIVSGFALTAVLVIVVLRWTPFLHKQTKVSLISIRKEMLEDYKLLKEIETIEKNPLPESLLGISSGPSFVFDEQLIDLMLSGADPRKLEHNQG